MLNKSILGLLCLSLIISCSKNEEQKDDQNNNDSNRPSQQSKMNENAKMQATENQSAGKNQSATNPFFTEYQTPFAIPPFDLIKDSHYLPAFEKAMQQHQQEIAAIVDNQEKPTFENTIVAYDKSGKLLDKVSAVFFNLSSAHTSDEIQEISKVVTPKLSEHADKISLNPDFYQRVKSVYEQRKELSLNTEQSRLLEKTYKSFIRSGADLSDEEKQKISKINQEISSLSLNFAQNLLEETNGFELVIDKKEDLAGLTEAVIAAGAQAAAEKDMQGKWVFTPHRSSMYPFITFSTKRELREKLYKAYINRGDNNNQYDNKQIVSRIAYLRAQKAKLLGYKTHAHYALEAKMASNPQAVYELLDRLWPAALKKAKQEAADMQAMIKAEGKDFKLAGWDWWYYAEKIRQSRYALDEKEVRNYLSLDNALNGIFTLANKLFGLTFEPIDNLQLYHKDVRAFQVKEADGSHLAIYLVDPYTHANKNGGAWSSSYQGQSKVYGEHVDPIIVNVLNFPAPIGDKPSLLTFEHVITLFHEFGHALHAMMSDVTYKSLAGTNTSSDHAEFPAQILERWAVEPEFLKLYAKHYKTGEVIPDELIQKIIKAGTFNQGFATTEYLAASLLDMNWHTLTSEDKQQDTNQFEADYLNKIGLIPQIAPRYRSTYFAHIFSGGWYSAGYYSYIWSEVLDRDAFQLFKEKGLYNKQLADSLRKNVYSAGNSDDLMKLYINFKGSKPKVDALIKGRGLE